MLLDLLLGPTIMNVIRNTLKYLKAEDFSLEGIFKKAVELADLEVVTKCVRRGVDTNVVFLDGLTALYFAAEQGNLEMVNILLSAKRTKLNPVSLHGYTPLGIASLLGHLPVMKFLLKRGCDANMQDNYGKTALHYAVIRENLQTTTVLLQCRADPNIFDGNGETPFQVAVVCHPNVRMAKLLHAFGGDVNKRPKNGLGIFIELALTATHRVHLVMLKYLISIHVDVNQVEPFGQRSALHMVAITNYIPALQILLDNGANRQLRDIKNFRPVDVAKKFRNIHATNFLASYVPNRAPHAHNRRSKRKISFQPGV